MLQIPPFWRIPSLAKEVVFADETVRLQVWTA